jgi:flagellar assembly protein FliH
MIAAKFTFDTEFRDEGDLVSNAARARQKKSYTQDEIDAISTRARSEGIKSGQVRAQEAIAAETAALSTALRAALSQSRADIEAVRTEAASIALAAAAKLARAALAVAPHLEVEAALRQAIHQAVGEPRIVLRASAAVVDALQPEIAIIAAEEGFDGRLILAVDPASQGADCCIEWRGSGAEHSQAMIEAALADLFNRHFSNSSPKG